MELARRVRDRLKPPKWFGPVVFGLGWYFALMLVPKIWPGVRSTPFFLFYTLSMLVTLAGLIVLPIVAIYEAIASKLDSGKVSARSYWLGAVAVWGFLAFGAAIAIARNVQGALPTGSYSLEFDPTDWKGAKLSNVPRDITARQKMLGSAVKRLNRSQTRADIEALLGPTLQTGYFQSNGRDLIYWTGNERDSFFSLDSEWLLIWLDEDGKFERYVIAND